MEPIIPLISSDTFGPLGVRHLPRLWLKTLLKAHGRLPEGYKDIRPGYDFMVLEGLGIDPDAARDFILREKPSYPAFEAWVKAQPGVDVSAANIERINEQVLSREKAGDSARKVLAAMGIEDDGTIRSSFLVNSLDDWHELHRQLGG